VRCSPTLPAPDVKEAWEHVFIESKDQSAIADHAGKAQTVGLAPADENGVAGCPDDMMAWPVVPGEQSSHRQHDNMSVLLLNLPAFIGCRPHFESSDVQIRALKEGFATHVHGQA
jgi:hypothetical protein